MYPFKLAIEQLRLASVQWSPAREAGERTRVADERLDEVQSLLELRMFIQLPGAIKALNKAVIDAKAAVKEAQEEGAAVSGVMARLDRVVADGGQVVQRVVAATASPLVGHDTADAIKDAVQQSTAVPPPDQSSAAPSNATPTPPATTPATPGTGSGTAPTTAPTTQPTTQPTTPTTNPPEPPPSVTPTTTAPPPTDPPTTAPPPPTEDTATPGSIGGGADDQAGPFGQAPPKQAEQAPETTLP
jgi:hypothetical protein